MIDILKLCSQGEEFNEAEARPKARLVVPNSSCGGIIGKGGVTIKYASSYTYHCYQKSFRVFIVGNIS